MDWNMVVERNRERLQHILAMLVAMAGLPASRAGGDAGGEATLPRHLHRAILALLRPAEAAARRLVIVVARDMVVTLPQPRKANPKPPSIFVRRGETRTGIVLPHGVKPGDILPNLAKPHKATRSLALPLLDGLRGFPRPRRARAPGVPRIWAPGFPEPDRLPLRLPPLPGDPIDARRLALRLQAIGRALDDLPGHARRFARWRARRDAAMQGIRHAFGEQEIRQDAPGAAPAWLPRRLTPLRPGRPPGGRRKPTHEVHDVLADLQYFAVQALERRDSS